MGLGEVKKKEKKKEAFCFLVSYCYIREHIRLYSVSNLSAL